MREHIQSIFANFIRMHDFKSEDTETAVFLFSAVRLLLIPNKGERGLGLRYWTVLGHELQ
jgi:hypothetical protein